MVDLTILSDSNLLLTLFIVISGVGLRTVFGMYGKPLKSLNPNLILMTFIIAVPASIGIIGPEVDGIQDDITPTELLVLIVGLIMVVFGGDVAVKKVSKVIAKTKDKVPKVILQEDPVSDVHFEPLAQIQQDEEPQTFGKGFDPNTGLPIR